MTDSYKDRFSQAEGELSEKSAFRCDGCQTEYTREAAGEKGNTCCGRSMTELLQEGFGP
jgi:hypothetical protein